MAVIGSGVRTPNGSENDEEDGFVFVFDRRAGNQPEQKIKTGGLFSFVDLKRRVQEVIMHFHSTCFVLYRRYEFCRQMSRISPIDCLAISIYFYKITRGKHLFLL